MYCINKSQLQEHDSLCKVCVHGQVLLAGESMNSYHPKARMRKEQSHNVTTAASSPC